MLQFGNHLVTKKAYRKVKINLSAAIAKNCCGDVSCFLKANKIQNIVLVSKKQSMIEIQCEWARLDCYTKQNTVCRSTEILNKLQDFSNMLLQKT